MLLTYDVVVDNTAFVLFCSSLYSPSDYSPFRPSVKLVEPIKVLKYMVAECITRPMRYYGNKQRSFN